jgi:hypothetical protein
MRCPYCSDSISTAWQTAELRDPISISRWDLCICTCPNSKCGKTIIQVKSFIRNTPNDTDPLEPTQEIFVYPEHATGRPVPQEVDEKYSKDFIEACKIVNLSPSASATLSRRCMQHILRGKLDARGKDLQQEIISVKDKLPSDVYDSLTAVREGGNLAAHVSLNTKTGVIVEVDQDEAEYLLLVIEILFHELFVLPKRSADMSARIKQKYKSKSEPRTT